MKKQWNKLAALLLVATLVMALFAGCGGDGAIGGGDAASTPSGGSTSSGDTAGDGTAGDKMFNVVMTATFSGMDPLRTNDIASTYVNAQFYETLYLLEPDGGVSCLLAEDFPEWSEDGLSVTIKLRQGVTFHDGTPFNADAVIYTLGLIKDPEFGSSRPSLATSIESMEAIDEYTVKFNLLYEDGVLLAKFAHTNSAIVSPTAQQNQDLMVEPCGTGPYQFVSSISGSNVVMTRFDDYWGDLPEIKDVTMTVISEESTAIARMETGEADMIASVTVDQIGRIENIANVTFETSEAARVYFVMLRPTSHMNTVMSNKDFRVAVAKAIDNEGYVEHILENYATVARCIIGPKLVGYTPAADSFGYAYDPEGARAILEENGWADEAVSLFVPSTPEYSILGEYIQANLTQAGFNNVSIESIDYSAWLTESQQDNRFDLSIAAWSNVTRDGTEFLDPYFHTVNSSQRARTGDLALDQLIDESKTTSDAAVRTEKIEAANRIIMEEAYAVPIYTADNLYCYNSAYEGVFVDPSGIFRVQTIKLK